LREREANRLEESRRDWAYHGGTVDDAHAVATGHGGADGAAQSAPHKHSRPLRLQLGRLRVRPFSSMLHGEMLVKIQKRSVLTFNQIKLLIPLEFIMLDLVAKARAIISV